MNAVKLVTHNVHESFAGQILSARIDPPPIQQVLGEIIRLANGTGAVEKASTLHGHMEKRFGIKHSNYRAIIGRLTEMNLIRRESNSFALCYDIKHPFSSFVVVRPEDKDVKITIQKP